MQSPVAGYCYTWGSGASIGVRTDGERVAALPTCVSSIRFIQVECGDNFTVGLSADGCVYSWGDNRNGRLGHDGPDGVPTLVDAIPAGCAVHIAAGQSHCLALCCVPDDAAKSTLVVYGWGKNFKSCLTPTLPHAKKTPLPVGISGSVVLRPTPLFTSDDLPLSGEHISNTTDPGDPIIFVAAGYANSACLTADGRMFMWGDNTFSKCGVAENTVVGTLRQVQLPSPSDRVAFCALGSLYTAAITTDGSVYTWGYGRSGNLGHGDRRNVATPTRVAALAGHRVVHVACTVGQINPVTTGKIDGQENPHTLFTTADGVVFSCGTCHKGILGNHSKKILSPPNGDELLPYRIGSATRDVVCIDASLRASGSDCDAAQDQDSTCFSPAPATRSQVGDVVAPIRTATDDNASCSGYLSGHRGVMAVSSSIHSCVVTSRGSLFSFGCGSGGRMGVERYLNGLHGGRSRMKCYISSPTAVEVFERCGLSVMQASSSRRHMAAVVVDRDAVTRL